MRSLTLLVLAVVCLLASASTAEAQGRRFPILGAICHPLQTIRMIRGGGQMAGQPCQCAGCPGNAGGGQSVASASLGGSCPTCPQQSSPQPFGGGGCPGGVCPVPRQSYYGIDGAAVLGAAVVEPLADPEAEARARRVRVAFALAAR